MSFKRPTRKELLKSPQRKWGATERKYNQVLLIPAGTKHDSGFMHIAVVGVYGENKDEYEICAYPDDISCHFPTRQLSTDLNYPLVRMDCWYPQGILQYHGRGKFKVGPSLSSVDIYFTPTN